MHFIFLLETALSDSTIPIPINFFVGSLASQSLGYDSIIVMQGVYHVNFTNYPQYGEVTFDTRLVGTANSNFTITVIPEGFLYAASINTTRSNIKDKSTISLRSSTAPFSIVGIDTVEIDSISLSGQCFFYNDLPESYYIVVQHRSSIETWFSNPVSITGDLTSYDFTSASSMAYGNNMNLNLGKWCLYSGDLNQSGNINLSDVIQIYNDAVSFATGNVVSDLTGDRITDLNDMLLAYNNATNFIHIQRP